MADRDGLTLVPIRVTATIGDGTVTFDFAGTAPVMPGSLNAVIAIAQSACYYVVRCLVGDDVPMNAGCFAPVQVIAPENSVVNARNPAAVAGGNVETSQRITDVVLGALAQALPDRIPAASQGTMNNVTMGGQRADGTPFAYYETIAGGMGASATADGPDGVQVHMTNTLNTPVEALEMAFPFRVTHYGLRPGSGGAGRHRGGDGIVREYLLLAPDHRDHVERAPRGPAVGLGRRRTGRGRAAMSCSTPTARSRNCPASLPGVCNPATVSASRRPAAAAGARRIRSTKDNVSRR